MGWLCQRCGAENQFKVKACWCCSKHSTKSYRVQERWRQFCEYLSGKFWAVIDAFVPEELYIALKKWNGLLLVLSLAAAVAVSGLMVAGCVSAGFSNVANRAASHFQSVTSSFSEREKAVPGKLAQKGSAIQANWPREMNTFRWSEQQSSFLGRTAFSGAQAKIQRLSQALSGLQLNHDVARHRWNAVKTKLAVEQARQIEQATRILETLLSKWKAWYSKQPGVAPDRGK